MYVHTSAGEVKMAFCDVYVSYTYYSLIHPLELLDICNSIIIPCESGQYWQAIQVTVICCVSIVSLVNIVLVSVDPNKFSITTTL